MTQPECCQKCGQPLEEWEADLCEGCGQQHNTNPAGSAGGGFLDNTQHRGKSEMDQTRRQDEWMAKSDAGEFVRFYNSTGCVMVFTSDEREAAKTTDPNEAGNWCRIAADVYGRKDSAKRLHLRMV